MRERYVRIVKGMGYIYRVLDSPDQPKMIAFND
jgi:hypothetical protein